MGDKEYSLTRNNDHDYHKSNLLTPKINNRRANHDLSDTYEEFPLSSSKKFRDLFETSPINKKDNDSIFYNDKYLDSDYENVLKKNRKKTIKIPRLELESKKKVNRMAQSFRKLELSNKSLENKITELLSQKKPKNKKQISDFTKSKTPLTMEKISRPLSAREFVRPTTSIGIMDDETILMPKAATLLHSNRPLTASSKSRNPKLSGQNKPQKQMNFDYGFNCSPKVEHSMLNYDSILDPHCKFVESKVFRETVNPNELSDPAKIVLKYRKNSSQKQLTAFKDRKKDYILQDIVIPVNFSKSSDYTTVVTAEVLANFDEDMKPPTVNDLTPAEFQRMQDSQLDACRTILLKRYLKLLKVLGYRGADLNQKKNSFPKGSSRTAVIKMIQDVAKKEYDYYVLLNIICLIEKREECLDSGNNEDLLRYTKEIFELIPVFRQSFNGSSKFKYKGWNWFKSFCDKPRVRPQPDIMRSVSDEASLLKAAQSLYVNELKLKAAISSINEEKKKRQKNPRYSNQNKDATINFYSN
eukprot:TRINITY_DN2415_c0_g1_i1.p1 TRINITY_DN2415_c0_g1~~TRINITY_DN2415_c0_g1_i1.p1  ORF type:complete len:527 (+),score=141.07 TRINITY_DN2415_c0_g1_i1:82-1662(+)